MRTNKIRQDRLVFSLGLLLCIILTLAVTWLQPLLPQVQLLPDQGPAWYYWKLPSPELWQWFSPWLAYLLHQIIFWGLLYRAKQQISHYSSRLHRYNWWALSINLLFVLIHMGQTSFYYDGLAQTTPVWSSQVAVAIMLIWILLMENRRRGLFFGKKVPISQTIMEFSKRNHGYYFSWAIIYTFWFHPMIDTNGHLAGFFYLFLLLLQSSLFFTRIHRQRWWNFSLEFIVLIHGTLVAISQPYDIWPMFAFGFGGVFIITQMHGLGLSLSIRTFLLLTYIIMATIIYSERSLSQLNELIRIPLIDYLSVLLLTGLFYLFLKIEKAIRKPIN